MRAHALVRDVRLVVLLGLALLACGDAFQAGAAGAGGAAPTTSTTSTSTSTTTGTGGAGGGQGGAGGGAACDGVGDCPASPSRCEVAGCVAGHCTVTPRAAGPLPSDLQVPGDCVTVVCDGAGNEGAEPDPNDEPPPIECLDQLCSSGGPTEKHSAAHTPCSSGVCDGAGKCVGCVDGTDCDSGVCKNDHCSNTPSCDDKAKNGSETGVDCGGDVCDQCHIGQGCVDASDCRTGVCKQLTCAACISDADCGQNGDCNKGICRRPYGAPCDDKDLCSSGYCTNAVCCTIDVCPSHSHCGPIGNCECDPGWLHCDAGPGCETDAQSPDHCGTCFNKCTATEVCKAGGCRSQCSPSICVDLYGCNGVEPCYEGQCGTACPS
jgi:hypothetical protein